MSGGPTQISMSVTRDCGTPPTITVNEPSTNGPPTWGTSTVTIGQTCMSPMRDAGRKSITTVGQPTTTVPPWAVKSLIRAAGNPPMSYSSSLDNRALPIIYTDRPTSQDPWDPPDPWEQSNCPRFPAP